MHRLIIFNKLSAAQEMTQQVTTADVAEVVLTEDDVPGAALGKRQPEELKVPELKR